VKAPSKQNIVPSFEVILTSGKCIPGVSPNGRGLRQWHVF